MAVDILNKIEHKFDDVLYKTSGEFLKDKALTLYSSLPYFAFGFSLLFFVFSVSGFSLPTSLFFLLSFFFTAVTVFYIITISSNQPNKACIGVINDGRSSQFKDFFNNEPKKIEYYAYIGVVVKNFLGKDKKEAVQLNLTTKSNKVYDVALDSKSYCTGYLLPGSTGSGKTVTLYTTVFLPAIISGNGFYYIEGKGDKDITTSIVSMIYQYGREQDTFIFDFGAATTGNYTNGINPLAIGNSKNVLELLKSLITIMTGENSWVTDMVLAFMGAILQPLVLLRDLNLIVTPDNLNDISTLEDFKNVETKNFTLNVLIEYLDFQAAIDLLYMMRRLFDDKAFVDYVKLNKEYANLRDIKGAILGQLVRMLKNSNVNVDTASAPDYSKLDPEIQKFNVKSITTWVASLTTFASEKYYGNVFNKETPDLDIVNGFQTNKIIIFILPSMSSTDDENKKIGGMAVALAKSAIGFMIEQGGLDASRKEQARQMRFRPRKLPYALVFDEPSNYANGDIPTMSSMVRSIGYDNGGMAIVASGQSLSDWLKVDDGKGIKKDQLIANLGFTQCLNIQDDGFKKLMKEKIGDTYVFREDQYDGSTDNTQIIRKREKETKYEENYFQNNLRIQTGESIIHMKGYINEEKMVTLYNEAPDTDLILNKFIDSNKLLNAIPTVKEGEEKINKLKEKYSQKIEDTYIFKANVEEGMNLSHQEEVEKDLKELARTCFPDLENQDNFTLTLIPDENEKAHGDYNIQTHEIRIYNAINKNREHLFATGIHEVCHHIEFTLHGDTGHGTRFYNYLYDLFCTAIDMKNVMFDYQEAKRRKAFDSSDIEQMEKKIGIPHGKKRKEVND